MPDPFVRTLRSLDGETAGRSPIAMAMAAALLAAWSAWFFGARLSVYVASDAARLEVLRATHPVDAPVAGRVVKLDVRLDQEVQEGDVLAELDADEGRMQLAEAKAHAAGIGPQLDATRAQMQAEQAALTDLEAQARAAVDEARSRLSEAQVNARTAREVASRREKLGESGVVSELDALSSRAEAEGKTAAERAQRAQLRKLAHEFFTSKDDRRTRVAALARDVAKLEAELAGVQATITSLEHQIDRRRIRAPASGRLGEIGTVRLGTVLKEGDRIGTIVSRGDIRVVAELPPADALGRVAPGQIARVRFDGFPWTEFGEVTAEVTEVASEVRDGHARTELVVLRHSPLIPMQHGLPGIVEIEIEKTTPARLVLRAAGQLIAHTSRPPAAAPSPGTTGPSAGVP